MQTRDAIRSLAWVAVLALSGPFATTALAAKSVSIDVNPGTSTGAVGYSTPGASDNAVYQYTINDGQSVSDTIPVQLCMTAYEAGWTSVKVHFANNGDLLGVDVPGDESFVPAATPDCRSLFVDVSTGPLASGPTGTTYTANLQLSDTNPSPATGSNKPQAAWVDIKKLQIQVVVQPAVSNVSCFLTDSEGNFLSDCSGAPVAESGSNQGRFAIVTNKRGIEVASNPGQFYYNLVWWNKTGATQSVDVNFFRTGVVPNGQQAIHAAIFNGYLDPLTSAEFATANSDGLPEGHDDAVAGVEVPAGGSLLVTYHLEWAGVGGSVPAVCAGTCELADQLMSVTGVVSGAAIATEGCTSDAYGYRKH